MWESQGQNKVSHRNAEGKPTSSQPEEGCVTLRAEGQRTGEPGEVRESHPTPESSSRLPSVPVASVGSKLPTT